MPTTDYIASISTKMNELTLVTLSIMSDLMNSGQENELTFEFVHMTIIIILGMYLLRKVIRYCRRPSINQVLLEKIIVIEENQEEILEELLYVKNMCSILGDKMDSLTKIVDQPFKFQQASIQHHSFTQKRKRPRFPTRAAKLRAQYKILYGRELKNE